MTRIFATVDGASSDARPTRYDSDSESIYVAEMIPGAGMATAEDDADGAVDVETDLWMPLWCCRGPARKAPPRTPEQALRAAAARGHEGLRPGDTVMLDGITLTL